MDLIFRNALRHHTPSRSNSALPQFNAGSHHALCANPGSIPQPDRFHDKAERAISPIMIPRAEISALGNTYIAPNPNLLQIVEPTVLADPRIVSHRKSPRILDPNPRFENDTMTDCRPE